MLITNLPDISGREYEILGLVEGCAVYSKHFGKDLMAGFKNMVGGELVGYTEMIDGAKELSLERLKGEALKLGADGILNIQYSLTNLQGGSALVANVVGTAIRFK